MTALPLKEIHQLEVTESYPAAIDELEKRIAQGHDDSETVIRLGFNLWYAVAEHLRLNRDIPTDRYRTRFVEIFRAQVAFLQDDPEFCWAFGLGFSLFAHEFEGVSESDGKALLDHAAVLDPFFASSLDGEELSRRFNGRGIFESYYATTAQQPGDGKPDPAAS